MKIKLENMLLLKLQEGKFFENNDNNFKSMTTYKNEYKNDIQVSSNYGFFTIKIFDLLKKEKYHFFTKKTLY